MKDYQPILFPYAYNILGSAEDARDAIQDVLAKYYSDAREGIENEKAYLIKSVINHAINMKTRRKRTVNQEVWLPEPVATESADSNIHLKDILSYSLLVLLEKLNARERAVFILKESFDYGHDEIAQILSITEEHSRKLLSRAKTKLFKPAENIEHKVLDERTSALLQNYIGAIRERDMGKLETLLAEDVVFYADGGGKLRVVRQVCTGAAEVAGLLELVYHTYQSKSRFQLVEVNHQPAFLVYNKDLLVTCTVFDISSEGKILQISTVVDPDKLKNIQQGL
ncbi:MAG: sigma-70 family RNA polymerase sigma factor [Bacteroidetes bacterium]|nr:sigma-70 family RNA polymerase sigma factor [Bacteroidota bacterium]